MLKLGGGGGGGGALAFIAFDRGLLEINPIFSSPEINLSRGFRLHKLYTTIVVLL